MPNSLVPGMLDMLAWNLNRGNSNVRLFEAGKKDTIEAIIEELACRSKRRRVPLG